MCTTHVLPSEKRKRILDVFFRFLRDYERQVMKRYHLQQMNLLQTKLEYVGTHRTTATLLVVYRTRIRQAQTSFSLSGWGLNQPY